jgi:hypothetical protein
MLDYWPQIAFVLTILLGWSGTLVGVVWHLNNKSIDEVKGRLGTLDTEFKELLFRLPIDYQRREDSIREYTVFNAKLDKTNENIFNLNQNIQRMTQ